MEPSNEDRLLKALKDIIEWQQTDGTVGQGLAVIHRAKALIAEIEGE